MLDVSFRKKLINHTDNISSSVTTMVRVWSTIQHLLYVSPFKHVLWFFRVVFTQREIFLENLFYCQSCSTILSFCLKLHTARANKTPKNPLQTNNSKHRRDKLEIKFFLQLKVTECIPNHWVTARYYIGLCKLC